jgi:dTDP-4-dehydrorhamnose reductase
MQENADGAYNLAEGASQRGIQLVTFSSDLVFDGNKPGPYVEGDPACPLNTYGFSKAEAERRVLAAMPGALVVRTSAFFGPWDTANFLFSLIRCIQDGNPFQADGELRVSPTYVPDLVHATLDLLLDGECGLIHLANAGMATWAEFGCMAAIAFRQNPDLVRPCPARDMRYIAPRPRQSALTSARRWIMPTLQNAIDRFARECELLARVPLQNVA